MQEQLQSHPNVQFLYFDVNMWEPRLFTNSYRGNIVAGLLSEEEIKGSVVSSASGVSGVSGGSSASLSAEDLHSY